MVRNEVHFGFQIPLTPGLSTKNRLEPGAKAGGECGRLAVGKNHVVQENYLESDLTSGKVSDTSWKRWSPEGYVKRNQNFVLKE